MTSNLAAAIATVLLVVVGIAQVAVLVAQHRQQRLDLSESHWRRWASLELDWATVVFVGRDVGDYYQVVGPDILEALRERVQAVSPSEPAAWALQATTAVTSLLSDVCLQILSGRLGVDDVYAVFGTAFLRQSQPLRRLLDVNLDSSAEQADQSPRRDDPHSRLRGEVQDWLIYHNGARRRCLILIDLLWAEAARLEDLPPDDVRKAAQAKRVSGHLNRSRVRGECLRLRGPIAGLRALRLARFLRHAEFRRRFGLIGLRRARLAALEEQWVGRLLREAKA